jgi:prepilin-type N-terminal cleavage/methylation domain-containing protein
VANARRGFTLVEIMLVLVLLVVIASLTMPIFEGGFASVRLKRSTDQVLAAWSEARAQAIDSGQVYQFRFQPETGTYRSERWYPEDVQPALEETTEVPEDVALPEQIVFVEGDVEDFDPMVGEIVTPMAQGGTNGWSSPILFFPDGSTSTASVLLRNDRQVFQRATLRALTGVGRASELLTEEQAERLQFQ